MFSLIHSFNLVKTTTIYKIRVLLLQSKHFRRYNYSLSSKTYYKAYQQHVIFLENQDIQMVGFNTLKQQIQTMMPGNPPN